MQAGREIKFRAWNKVDEVMVLPERMFCQKGNGTVWHVDFGKKSGVLGQGIYVMMQFTGLHDANKVPIFEGDILEDFIFNKRYEVIWDDYGMFLFNPVGTTGNALDYYELEDEIAKCATIVVGNRYRDPNLLEVANDASRT
ncbi:YopX family protein [Brevibacillus sp. HD3.3A]|uniref:YopX family protein n=1 Tax=Brevibacillus sp. HD3.3A TaxID=2738979 RepID=UPI00156B96D3|nr:YopX family protein [Brevibacillus sp. HD3.3A]UED70756.1 YopX family protein [Brevibacillus sp. HD3.3A]